MDIFQKNILGFGKQLSEKNISGFNLEKLRGARPDGIVIAGMGGSGLAGEILNGVKKEIGVNMPVIIWKDYGLPDMSPDRLIKNPLYIFVSFSGTTEETLSGIKQLAKKAKMPAVAVVTTGGELKRLAEKKTLPLALFQAGSLTPRQSAGIMFYGLTKILKAAGVKVGAKEYSEEIKPEKFRSEGKKLASLLKNRIVCVYTDANHRHLGYIWKIKFNETAKNPAFSNVLPEMNHNEIVGFENGKFKTAAIFLESDAHPRTKKRFKLTESLLKEKGALIIKLKLSGKTGLEKSWRTIALAEWTTYFLAKLNAANPLETKSIDKLKRLMR